MILLVLLLIHQAGWAVLDERRSILLQLVTEIAKVYSEVAYDLIPLLEIVVLQVVRIRQVDALVEEESYEQRADRLLRFTELAANIITFFFGLFHYDTTAEDVHEPEEDAVPVSKVAHVNLGFEACHSSLGDSTSPVVLHDVSHVF
jgi:hypothetical protein